MRHFNLASRLTGALLLMLSAPFALQAQDSETAYGYFRIVEGGTSTLTQAETGEREDIEQHLPILVGDQISVAPSGRLEIILPTFDVLRIDGATELAFEALADSPDANDEETVLRLFEGELQAVLFEDPEVPFRETSVRTRDFAVYFHAAGTYLVGLDASENLRVVAREGYAEVVTDRGSTIVRAGDEATVSGGSYPATRMATAGSLNSFERWGEDLWQEGQDSSYAYAGDDETYRDDIYDSRLRYSAAPLDDYGDWIRVEGQRAWRPRGADGWRPYYRGRWVSTPDGLSWVSYEPWGWVPYHYGGWDRVDGFGWVWFPGRRFSVAHVHWYWGQDYAAWYPSGYYNRHYNRRFGWDRGFSAQFAGWGGGAWDSYNDWVFCPTVYLGRQRQDRYARSGRSVHEYTGWRELPRGVITTDTRRVTPDIWRNPDKVEEVMRRRLRRDDRGDVKRELPDLTAYVAREPRLSSEEVLRELRGGATGATLRDPRSPRSKEVIARPAGNGSLERTRPVAQEQNRRTEIERRQTPARPVPTIPTRDGRIEAQRETAREAPTRGRVEVRQPVSKTPSRTLPPTRIESRPTESVRPNDRRVETKRTETTRAQPKASEPTQTRPSRVVPQKVEPRKTEPQRTVPQRTEPQRTVPQRTVPQRTLPRTTEPRDTGNRDAGSRTIERQRVETRSAPSRPAAQRPAQRPVRQPAQQPVRKRTESPPSTSGTVERRPTSVRSRSSAPPRSSTSSKATPGRSTGTVSGSPARKSEASRATPSRSTSSKSSTSKSSTSKSSTSRSSTPRKTEATRSTARETTAKPTPQRQRPAPKTRPAPKKRPAKERDQGS